MERKDLFSIAFNPKNNTLATSGYSNGYTDTIVWDLATGKPIKKLPQVSSYTVNLRFSHQGDILAWINPRDFFNTYTSLYDINTSQKIQTINDRNVAVFEFSPDDTMLTLGGIYGWGTRNFDIATSKFITEPNNNSAKSY